VDRYRADHKAERLLHGDRQYEFCLIRHDSLFDIEAADVVSTYGRILCGRGDHDALSRRSSQRRVHAKSRRATSRTTSSARFPSAVRVHPLPVSRSTFGTICSCSEGVALATRDRGAWIAFAVRTHDLPVCRSHLRHICSRRRFAETVVAALKGTKWPIIVYSSYEKTQLTELGRLY
jgi:hypothetical protein